MTVHQISVRMEGPVMMESIATPVSVTLATLVPIVKLVSSEMAAGLGMIAHITKIGSMI